MTPTTTTSLTSKHKPEVVFFVILTQLPLPPPPSCPNTSRRWSFQCLCHHHHLPHVQTRARGGSFCHFDMTPTTTTSLTFKRKLEVVVFVISMPLPHHHLPHIQMRAGGGSFCCFDMLPTTTTSLASKREPEEVHFIVSTHLPPPPPPSFRNTSQTWFISPFRHASHHYHLPCIQAQAGGGPFQWFQGIRRRRHIITACESIMAKIDKRGRGR